MPLPSNIVRAPALKRFEEPAFDRLPVTVVIPVKNEETNLPKCLSALSRFAAILVVDSQSSDRTVEIAEDFGAQVLQFYWDGGHPKKRNWILHTHQFSTPWVLFLDADEIVRNEFCCALEKACRADDKHGYWLTYSNYFLGKQLRFGLPQRKLALFRVGSGFYERIDENSWSKLDMEVHEHPIISGTVGEISVSIEHNDFKGVAAFVDRHLAYARWEANRYLALDQSRQRADWTWRQRFKYRRIETWWYCWAYFGYTYLLKLGLLDGAAGLHYALYKLWYFRTIRLLILEEKAKA